MNLNNWILLTLVGAVACGVAEGQSFDEQRVNVQAAPAQRLSAAAEVGDGRAYAHDIVRSRFDVGANLRSMGDARQMRTVGDRGVFMRDLETGASLAVRNATAELPQPLTTNPDEHSREVLAYLTQAGVPAEEVSGTHVTTAMGGSGPIAEGVQPGNSKLLFYATHLERSIDGVRVEGSVAYAAFDRNGDVISEAVYWPPIPKQVVAQATALKRRMENAAERAAFLDQVRAVDSHAAEAQGIVRIVHTSASHHGAFEAKAVYTAYARERPGRGKFRAMRFDDQGKNVFLADELPSGVDAVKLPVNDVPNSGVPTQKRSRPI